jgi:hypothetical protein
MDEVIDPSLVIYGEGFLRSGLILYILNKIEDTNYGEKYITLIPSLAQVKRINLISGLAKNYKLNINSSRCFHTKVRAFKRIGPDNEDVFSVIVGFIRRLIWK